VGIGTTSPGAALHVTGSAGGTAIIEGSTQSTLNLKTTSGGVNNYIAARNDGDIAFSPGGSEKVTLQSDGNVGIGTTSPDYKLEVESTSDADLVSIKSTAGANNTQMRLGISGSDSVISGTGGSLGNLVFKTYGSERMRIDTTGNVGIGTTSPGKKLDVTGTSRITGEASFGNDVLLTNDAYVYSNNGGSGVRAGWFLDGTNQVIKGFTAAAERMRIDSSGTIIGTGTYTTSNSIKIFEAQRLGGAVASDWSYDDATTDMSLGTSTAHSFSFKTGGTRALTIDSSQNVGIGTTSPSAKLHISGTIADNREFQVGSNYLVVTGSNGNVGIGTTSPSQKLEVNGSALVDNLYLGNTTTRLSTDGSGEFGIDYNSSATSTYGLSVYNGSTTRVFGVKRATGDTEINGDLTVGGKVTAQEFHTEFVSASIIYQSGSTKFGDTSDDVHSFSGSLRVTGSGDHYFTDGNVGIGTTSPSGKLEVSTGTTTAQLRLANTSGTNWDFYSYTDSNFYINNASGTKFTILNNGNVGIGTINPSTALEVNGTATVTSLVETSTRKLKENIETLEDQSSIVDSLQPVSYTWKESKEEDFGLVAEDVAEIAPHLVSRDEDGNPSGIKYSKLSVLLLDVVQRQSTLIEDLNERITKLENERG